MPMSDSVKVGWVEPTDRICDGSPKTAPATTQESSNQRPSIGSIPRRRTAATAVSATTTTASSQ